MTKTVYIVLKSGMPIIIVQTPEEADNAYMEYDADEIRECLIDFL